MRHRWLSLVLAGLLVLGSAGCAKPADPVSPPCPECATDPADTEQDLGFAVFGDYPYGESQERRLPYVVDQINADPDVDFVFHLGDIKQAGDCSDRYYARIKKEFDRFREPLVYTFGDNEWTDCSRPDNGSHQPLERLAALRRTFVPNPGFTLGRAMPVTSQAQAGFPENVWFYRGDISFGAFHAVGSQNGLNRWSGRTKVTPAQRAEVEDRSTQASLLIRQVFATAREERAEAVVLMTQADMFFGEPNAGRAAPYRSIVATLAGEASTFPGTVYLFNGDSHSYVSDHPLGADTGWAAVYRVRPAGNLKRITVDGGVQGDNYLRATALPFPSRPLRVIRVPFEDE